MKVMLDPGHGGAQFGAVFGGLAEKDLTLEICLRSYEYLLGYCTPVLTRVTDKTLTLMDRCVIEKVVNPDIFISVHLNADPDPDTPDSPVAEGSEIFYFSEKGKRVATAMASNVGKMTNASFRGVKKKPYYVLKQTNSTAVLVECCFIDNPDSQLHKESLLHCQFLSRCLTDAIKNVLKKVKEV